MQKNLTKLGYNTKGTDGIFGNDTKKAVIAFQKAYKLTQDGIVGASTQSAIDKALKKKTSSKPAPSVKPGSNNSSTIQKMLDNIKNDKTLGLSSDKKTAMIMAGERLLKDGYDVKFVAGVLGNIQNEGTPGRFESSHYITNPENEPDYLVYMDNHFNYRSKFSGKSICDVGISAAVKLQKQAASSGKGKFGLGMIQWTGSRTAGLLKAYQKYIKHDKPTMSECIMAEVNFMADELKSSEFSGVYTQWKKGAKTASSAGEIVCKQYEKPKDMVGEAKSRAKNASKIYNVMMK